MTKVLGSIPILLRFCESIGLGSLIDEICPPRQQSDFSTSIGEVISLLTINRLTEPTPLYKIEEWIDKNGIDLYINDNGNKFNDDRLGRVLDHIYPYWGKIKQQFVVSCIEKFKIDPSVVHYDITSLYFEGQYEDIDFITYGYSRDQKPDKKQINIALNMSDNEPFTGIIFLETQMILTRLLII